MSAVIALTHQSLAADVALSQSGAVDLVLGGHEHEVSDETLCWEAATPCGGGCDTVCRRLQP